MRRNGSIPFVSAVLAGLFFVPPPASPAEPQITPLITDRSPVQVSDQFNLPTDQALLTPAGNAYFATGGLSALFRWDSATGSRTRLLQANDPMPGLKGATLWRVGAGLHTNSAGHLAMVNNYSIPGVSEPNAVFVYDGSTYRKIAAAGETAPGASDYAFAAFGAAFINDAGDVAFWANLIGTEGLKGMLFLYPRTGPPVLIAKVGDASPAGSNYRDVFSIFGLNNAGQVAFLAELDGSPGRAVFLYSPGTGVQAVVEQGDPTPDSTGNFSLLGSARTNYRLNASGKVAFLSDVSNSSSGVSSGIWVGSIASSPIKVIATQDPTGSSIGGTCSALSFFGFNDAGSVLYSCDITGGDTSHALFLKTLPSTTQIVAQRGQIIPDSGGDAFDREVASAVLNQAGQAVFLAHFTGGIHAFGLLLGGGDTLLTTIALEGEPSPLGGTFGLVGRSSVAPVLNGAGHVLFTADVLGSNLTALFFRSLTGTLRSVVNSSDPLPAGANLFIQPTRQALSSSDDEVLVSVCRAGGKGTIFAKSIQPGAGSLQPIASDFEAVPGVGVITAIGQLLQNNSEEVAFQANIVSASGPYPASAIFFSRPGSRLRKLAMTGDPLPGGGNLGVFRNIASQLNRHSRVAFSAQINNSPESQSGVFLASPAGIQKVVRTGDSCGTGTCLSFGSLVLNDAGKVGFYANTAGATGSTPALAIGSSSTEPILVVKQNDLDPDGLVISSLPSSFQFNNLNQFAFFAGSGSTLRLLRASLSGLARIVRNGDPAPGCGFFADFRTAFSFNNTGSIAFRATLSSCAAAQGAFVGDGISLHARLLLGQSLPGGGNAGNIGATGPLSDSGELAIYVPSVSDTGLGLWGEGRVFSAASDGALRLVATTGTPAQGTGSDFGVLLPLSSFIYNSANDLFFGSILMRGPAHYGYFRYGLLKK